MLLLLRDGSVGDLSCERRWATMCMLGLVCRAIFYARRDRDTALQKNATASGCRASGVTANALNPSPPCAARAVAVPGPARTAV